MGSQLLPEELATGLNDQLKCRELQIRQLSLLLGVRCLTPVPVLSLMALPVHPALSPDIDRPWRRSDGQIIDSKCPAAPSRATLRHCSFKRMHHNPTSLRGHNLSRQTGIDLASGD